MRADVLQLESQVESLQQRVDELLENLAGASRLLEQINTQFEDLPSVDDLQEYSDVAGQIAQSMASFERLWNGNDLPSIDELREYADAASEIANGPRAANR
jgi:hypothetical protein